MTEGNEERQELPAGPDGAGEAVEPAGPKALTPFLRYPLVILLGVLLAGGTFYLLKKLGY
jgi:hypothetical protein